MRKKTYLFRVLFCFFYIGLFTLYSRYSFAYERVYYSEGMNGAVSCGHPLAAKTAIKVLKDGGNAVDAAIAAAFVLGVVDFSNSGIGGEGFALVYHPSNKIIAIDGSTKRPTSDIRNEYDCSIALPAIPEMLLKMRRLYGTKSAKELISPAIDLCNKGFEVSNYLAWVISNSGNKIKDSNALKLIKPDGKLLKAGQLLKQPLLGRILEQMSKDQGMAFYYGFEADKTLIDMKTKGSTYSKYDFMHYRSRLCKPIKVTYKQYEIYGHPLPSCSVATIKLALKLLSTKKPLLNQSVSDYIAQANICRDILNEKYYILSDFINDSIKFLSVLEKCKSVEEKDDSHTTHLCVWDKNNMIVSMTLTLGNHFGTGQLAPGGFFYANSLRNYSKSVVNYSKDYPKNQGPITTKSPIIVTKLGKPWLSLGGAGANRIVTNTALMLARMISGYGIEESINEPRYYMEFNGKIYIEENPSQQHFYEKIRDIYPNIEKKNYLHDYFGLLSAIVRPSLTDSIQTVGDKHRDGSCLTY